MLDVKRALAAARAPERTHTLPLSTPWGDALAAAGDDAEVLPEHPRPALERASYTMLNGWWDYAFVPTGRVDAVSLDLAGALALVSTATPPATFAGRIRVPFSPEAPLSGVRRTLTPGELLWYRRRVSAPARGAHDRVILHVDAVDWVAAVRVNGQLAATHIGGYLPFELDVTPYLNSGAGADTDGVFLIEVCVYDPSDAGTQPRGKQRLHPGGIWYTAQSGIWQSVWLEVVPAAHLLKDKGARLCMISPYNVRHMGEMQPEVCYHFELGGVVYNLTAVLDPKRPAVPSITPVFDNADWHEREMMELFKISVEQHPNPRRLFLDEKLDAGILNQAVPLSVMMNGACTTDLWERILAGKGDKA